MPRADVLRVRYSHCRVAVRYYPAVNASEFSGRPIEIPRVGTFLQLQPLTLRPLRRHYGFDTVLRREDASKCVQMRQFANHADSGNML